MGSTNVQLQIGPSLSDVVARIVGAVKAKQEKRLLQHFWRLAADREPRILVGDILRREREEGGIRRRGEDHRWLGILQGR